MKDEQANIFSIDISDKVSAIRTCLQTSDEKALGFIKFFRQINGFENLNSDDKFILIKYNILSVFPIQKAFNYKKENHYLSTEENEESIKFNQFFDLFDQSYYVRDTLINLISSIVQLTEQDPITLSFLLIIIVLSPNLITTNDQPMLKDSKSVNKLQSHYIELFWNFLIKKLNDSEIYQYFIKFLSIIFQIQSSSEIFRDFILNHHIKQDHVSEITPLMQTFLNIS